MADVLLLVLALVLVAFAIVGVWFTVTYWNERRHDRAVDRRIREDEHLDEILRKDKPSD